MCPGRWGGPEEGTRVLPCRRPSLCPRVHSSGGCCPASITGPLSGRCPELTVGGLCPGPGVLGSPAHPEPPLSPAPHATPELSELVLALNST